jgi:hypothetical protein
VRLNCPGAVMTKESIGNTVGMSEGRVLGEKIVLKVKVKR